MARKKIQQNRSELILEAASALFAQFGYQKTTLEDIALRAGIGKGSVYLEFESKEAILFALILENKQTELEHMRRVVSRSDKSPLALLKIMLVQNVGEVFASVRQNRRSPEEMAASGERVRLLLAPFFQARLSLVETLLQRAQAAGEMNPAIDASHSAQLILLALRGVLPPYEASATRVKLQHQAAELLELLFSGLRVHASGGSL
jgi:AcrR family transcriptional regulator